MKKYISLFLCLTCILTLVACGKKAAPIQLPQTSDITSVDVTVGENTTNHSDTAWIRQNLHRRSSAWQGGSPHGGQAARFHQG